MKGASKGKSAGSQFVILIVITLISLFVVAFIGTVILANITGIGLKDLTELAKMDFSRPETMGILRGLQIIQFFALFLIPVFICSRLFSDRPNEYIGLKKPYHNGYYFAGAGILLLAIPLTLLSGELNKIIPVPDNIENWISKAEEEAARTMTALLSRRTFADLILNIICIAGLAAVGEELLFRGIVQRLLIKIFKSPFAGILIAAILFSAMHMQFYGFLPRLILGVILGYIYWYSGSLWTAIFAHFIYDAFMIVLVYLFPDMINEMPIDNKITIIIISVSCAVLMGLTFVWMKKKSNATFSAVYADDAIPVKDNPF